MTASIAPAIPVAPTVIETLDPDLTARMTSRRGLFTRAAGTLGVLASAPTVLAVASTEAFAQALPGQVVDVLRFALTLEYLEAEFYRTALATPHLIPARYRAVFTQLARHEAEHVRLLQGALGSAAIPPPAFDFTGKGKYPDVFANFDTFTTLSSTFEDLGVAAYKGQAGNLQGTPVLTTALQIHSVEARHAAEVRRVRGFVGWDGAFDAPLTKAAVLAAAAPFLAGGV
ncbi:ferritin-like domain-containing protein [Methylobacterium sp. NMS14P]|uniref:ferritin-like domain-containing protein n=1 Tax=Methylobacterium sp. NMS14P TaxID=2894310 RepID=UPI0023590112|nr:ferritin-like domain-containing protein [Methylobacterium sp. NMS14P]WCS24173.1 ferritin-like domain-containing protein [Methylobacterium sp. NMS14P]